MENKRERERKLEDQSRPAMICFIQIIESQKERTEDEVTNKAILGNFPELKGTTHTKLHGYETSQHC